MKSHAPQWLQASGDQASGWRAVGGIRFTFFQAGRTLSDVYIPLRKLNQFLHRSRSHMLFVVVQLQIEADTASVPRMK